MVNEFNGKGVNNLQRWEVYTTALCYMSCNKQAIEDLSKEAEKLGALGEVLNKNG